MGKEIDRMSRLAGQLEKVYEILNDIYYRGQLPMPVITIQTEPKEYGHMTTKKVWKRKDEKTYELNISSCYLDREPAEVLTTLLHEMVHIYCQENNIKDTSNRGRYHNKLFKQHAEAVELECYQNEGDTVGWRTKAGPRQRELATMTGMQDILINRDVPQKRKPKKRSHIRKYICPVCGNSVRASKEIRIMCLDCNEDMREA